LDLLGGDVHYEGAVEARFSVTRNLDNLLIRGKASGVMAGECYRCAVPFQTPVSVELTVYAERAPDGGTRGLDRELESDQYLCFHDGSRLELGQEVREALILAVPIQPLCRPDCRGICPGCGADLNVEACRCAERAAARAPAPNQES
jgi:uncharacterized protein